MGSLKFKGVQFRAYPGDHTPRHVHGFYNGVEVIFTLHRDRAITLADRVDAIRPNNGKRADVKHILTVAASHFNALVALSKKMEITNG